VEEAREHVAIELANFVEASRAIGLAIIGFGLEEMAIVALKLLEKAKVVGLEKAFANVAY
jgi:hypothetical protein